MVTDEEILVRARTYELDCHKKWRLKGGKSDHQIHWECWEDQLLEFARAMLREGYHQGVNDGQGHD